MQDETMLKVQKKTIKAIRKMATEYTKGEKEYLQAAEEWLCAGKKLSQVQWGMFQHWLDTLM